MKSLFIYLIPAFLILSCSKPQVWKLKKTLELEGVKPIGITVYKNDIWISDGDHNRLVQITPNGSIKKEVPELQRPMHIASSKKEIWIPEYGSDTIRKYANNKLNVLHKAPKLDAPAGVWVEKKHIAIADFYAHKIHYYNGEKWISFGEKGHSDGKLHYPTDVQLADDLIYVADAYNNRIQVFDHKGNFVKKMVQELNMNAATGIFVSKQQIFTTDFENNRVLVLSKKGELLQELKQDLHNPTDALLINDELYILNYKTGTLSIFES